MNFAAILEVDLETAPPGRRSRLAGPLAGTPVVRRTVERFSAAESVSQVILVAPPEQCSCVAELCAGLPVRIEPRRLPAPAYLPHVWSARKWCPGGWRGGLGDTTIFDEFMSPGELARVARAMKADVVLTAPAASCLIDPALIDQVAGHHEKHFSGFRLTFTQAPPGMSVSAWQVPILAELAAHSRWPGSVLAYNPEHPILDMTVHDCHCSIDPAIARCSVRLLADGRRSFELCEQILSAGQGLSAAETCRLAAQLFAKALPMPDEVEIELTTQDDVDDGLYPRRPSVSPREPMDLGLFEKLIDEIAAWDDARVTLGGFGDPLRHPHFARTLEVCRQRGLFGLHVQTAGLGMTEAAADAIIAAGVDVVSLLVDADDPERYARVHGLDGYGRVMAAWETLVRRREAAGSPRPVVTAVMTKAKATLDGMDAFYDGWVRRCGSGVIVGHSDRAGQRPNLAVVDMRPPARCPCRRLRNRTIVLADGTVPYCEEDFNGLHPAGRLTEASLQEIWQGDPFGRLREAHRAGRYDVGPLCSACREWHRP